MITLLKLQKLARDAYPNQVITASHLLVVWAAEEPGDLETLLSGADFDVERLTKALEPLLQDPAAEDKAIIMQCIRSVSGTKVTGWHLLGLLCNDPQHRITKTLIESGLSLEGLKRELAAHAPQNPLFVVLKKSAKPNPMLEFGRDLTEEAANGVFDDLCERPHELERVLTVLQMKERGNPVLTGYAGAGKTALVELLARYLLQAKEEKLKGTRLFELSLGKLVAGTKYRGEFEARFQDVMKALEKEDRALLFIDEFHLIWGAGRAEGAPMDAANLLKPALNRGNLRIIGATTSEEYQNYITRDSALRRRFREVALAVPDGEMLFEMVKKKREGLEEYHAVKIPDAVVLRAIELADLHLPNVQQPAKSIDLLDDSAAAAARRGAAELTEDDLLKSLERTTGRPLLRADDETKAQLLQLGAKLRETIIGQDGAIDEVANALVYKRTHPEGSSRNLGAFLFIGSTGVGKTELARSLASAMFGSQDDLLHLDMADYGSFDAVHKLIGSPSVFAGSEQGVLAKWLYAHGTGVILFDEIEKASTQIMQLLLGMLDRGRMRNARGEELDTRQCVVIFTSNALLPAELKRDPIGFPGGEGKSRQDIVEMLSESKKFAPEFLGRLDEIILFNDLSDEVLSQILKMRINEELSAYERDGVAVRYDEEELLKHLLRDLTRGKSSGARGMKRIVDKTLMQPLAIALAKYEGDRPVTAVLGKEFYTSSKVRIEAGAPS